MTQIMQNNDLIKKTPNGVEYIIHNIEGCSDSGNPCSCVIVKGKSQMTYSDIELGVSSIVKGAMYNEYIKKAKYEDPVRIIIFGLNGLFDTIDQTLRKIYSKTFSLDEKYFPNMEITVFFGGMDNDWETFDNTVQEYIDGSPFAEYEDINRDNPWIRVIAKQKRM